MYIIRKSSSWTLVSRRRPYCL